MQMNSSNLHEQLQQQFQPAATFNELLINEVRSHPQLYDQQHRVCTDNGERNAIWEVIASRIDDSVNGEFAKKRWLQMRDRYRKELKMALRTSIQPKWPYFSKLAWLDPYLKDAKNIKSVAAVGHHQQSNALGALTDLGNNAHPQIGSTFRGDFADQFRFSQLGSTVNFLESLMAASNAILQQHQRKGAQPDPNGDFSPDSAEASTSEGGSGGDGGAVERQQNHNLMLNASSHLFLGDIGTDQPTATDQRSSTSSPKDNEMEEDEEGPNDQSNDEDGEELGGQNADQQGAKCHTDEQSLLRRSSSVSSPPGSAVDPSMEFSLNALFAQSSPLRLFGSKLLNAPTATTSVDSDHHQKHSQCHHRRALSAFAPVSKQSVVSPLRHHRAVGTSVGNGSQPPYLVRRGFGASKFRGRLVAPLSATESANSVRKFDIASMCSSPVATTDGFGGRDKESGGDGDTATPEGTANGGKANSKGWAMEWAVDSGGTIVGTTNANGVDTGEDEDALFARLVVARLKKFDTKERRAVRSRIFQWLDQKEEEMETTTAGK